MIVENTHLFGDHQQKHYMAQLTWHQIKFNRKDVIHRAQPTVHRYLIKMQQSTSTTLVFARPHNAYETFNLNKPKPVVICKPYKVAMLKHVKYQPVPQDELEKLANRIIIIGITS
jgi:CHASE2 domain-containing sensor protein